MGVLMSWLMFERKVLLASLAALAEARAVSKAVRVSACSLLNLAVLRRNPMKAANRIEKNSTSMTMTARELCWTKPISV